MSANETITYKRDQSLPAWTVAWYNRNEALYDFATGWTFEVVLSNANTGTDVLTKTSGIVGYDTAPNVSVGWAAGELDVEPGTYFVLLSAIDGASRRNRFRPGNPPTIRIEAV